MINYQPMQVGTHDLEVTRYVDTYCILVNLADYQSSMEIPHYTSEGSAAVSKTFVSLVSILISLMFVNRCMINL